MTQEEKIKEEHRIAEEITFETIRDQEPRFRGTFEEMGIRRIGI